MMLEINIANIWEEFHLLRPHFMWLMIPLVVLFVMGLIRIREQIRWKKYIDPVMRPYVIKKGSNTLQRWMQLLSFLVLSSAVVGISGPSWEKIELPDRILETPLVIVLDLSQSMMASDLSPNRLERAKFKIQDLLDADPKVRIALVGFAGTAHTIVPLTRDYKLLDPHLKSLTTEVLPFQGTDVQSALNHSKSILDLSDAPGTLVFISDQFDEVTFDAFQGFSYETDTRVILIPMGTSSGAEVPRSGSKQALRDASGKVVTSSLDRQVMAKLESLEKVELSELTLDDSDMQLLAKSLRQNLQFRENQDDLNSGWKDQGLPFILPLALFLLMWFRKGWVLYMLPLVITLGSCSNDPSNMSSLWYTDGYKAQSFYDSGNYEEAALLFEDPMRKGVSYFKAGDYEKAASQFALDSTASGQYNLGLAYVKAGFLEQAKLAFENALFKDPSLKRAQNNLDQLNTMISMGQQDVNDATEFKEKPDAENIQNKDFEDLGGGGQEATEEDMKKERKEETVATETRMGKELDELPDDFSTDKQEESSQKVLMRKVDDDPSLFLKRKFKYQVKKDTIRPNPNLKKW